MSEHLSASSRRIRDLEAQLNVYLLMAKEYNAFVNYVIAVHGIIPEPFNEHTLTDAIYTFDKARMAMLEHLTVRAEESPDGKTITMQRIASDGNQLTKSLLILPPSRA